MADKKEDDHDKRDDPLEGTSRQARLSAEDRDAIVESLLQKLAAGKEKADPSHPADSGKTVEQSRLSYLATRFMPNSHVSC